MKEDDDSKYDIKGLIPDPWSKTKEEILDHYKSSKDSGLSEREVDRRQKNFGLNKIKETSKKSRWTIFVDQFKSFLVGLLGLASIVSFVFGETIEAISISVVLLINAVIGFITESKAADSMESLKEMTRLETKVCREGEEKKVNAKDLVPGDIVVLQSGDMVPADLRVIEYSKLQTEESALTGESTPVDKTDEKLDEDPPLAERRNMLYKGTHLSRGTARAVVVSTGSDTELGKISESIVEAEEGTTPLEENLDQLGKKLAPLLVVIAFIIGVAGLVRGMDLYLMIETSIALAVAAVPEGLPIVATLALARGMWRMADQNAIVNRLSSVETLGSTSIICTDKTGTLTRNEMTVDKFEASSKSVDVSGKGLEADGKFFHEQNEVDISNEEIVEKCLEVGVLCNNASYKKHDGEKEVTGDPMEVALLVAGLKAGIERNELVNDKPEVKEVSFDPAVKMMATYHQTDQNYTVAVKGAPGAVLDSSSHILTEKGKKELDEENKEKWIEKNDQFSKQGLRVLALATKNVKDTGQEPYNSLSFLGFVVMNDPPREEVKPAIEKFHNAGIRVVMATGDHASVAKNIGSRLDLFDDKDISVIPGDDLDDPEELKDDKKESIVNASIFARVNPENKQDLVEIHQETGSIVAMTGDGVNDAPALKKADIGVTMGERGTQVAKEAADIVLADDNFETISKAVKHGRIIFRNIRKFVVYLLSGNMSQLLAIFIASLMGYPLPILPLQILFLNIVNDVFPAFALGVGEGNGRVMSLPPRDPDESVLTKNHWTKMGIYGILIAFATIGAFYLGSKQFGMTVGGSVNHRVVTVSFLTLAFSRLWHVFDMRDSDSNIWINEITENKFVWAALGLCSSLLLAAVYLPGFSTVLQTQHIGLVGWLIVLGMSLLPIIVIQLFKELNIL